MKDLIQKVLSTEVNEEKLNTLLTPIIHQFEGMSSEDILKHFVSFEVNRILEYYENAPDINLDVEKENERRRNLEERNRERGERRRRERENRERGDRRDREDRPNRNERRSRERGRDEGRSYTRFFVNIGKKEQLDQSKLLRLLNEHANDRDIHYGAIDIMRSFTFFEVESKYTDKILRSLENAKYEGMPVSVQVAQAPKQPELPAKNKKHDDFRDGRRGGDFRGGRGFGKSKRGGDRRFDRDRGNKKGRRRDF